MAPSRQAALALAALLSLTVPAAAAPTPASAAAGGCPWLSSRKSPDRRAQQVLRAMTLDDKITMVTGVSGFGGRPDNVGAAGQVKGNPALCIPPLVHNDAGAGLGDLQINTTAYPDAIAQTATWDSQLQRGLGVALGQEAFAKGVNVLLAPGLNVERTPLGGRNFEYAGEDPYLAGKSAAAIIRGVQTQNVVATVKHYALNSQELNRGSNSEDVDERTMQEIYLAAFETAVREGGAGAVMCAYNKVNGVYACENPRLLRSVLKRQFGFGGWVMSDFSGTHSTVASAKAGLDVEMPGGPYFGVALKAAVQSGQVPMARLDDMARRVLRTMFRLGLFNRVPAQGPSATNANTVTPQHLAVARSVAEQGSVLLKNDHALLPLATRGKTIAVIGPAADAAGALKAYQGGGSGHVPLFPESSSYVPAVSSPLDAITRRAQVGGATVLFDRGTDPEAAAALARRADVSVVVVSNAATESRDLPDLRLRHGVCGIVIGCQYDAVDQDALISAVAAANPRTAVVLQTGGAVAMPWLPAVPSVLETWYPGQQDGNAVASLLFGDVNPSGKLPTTFPRQLSDGPLRTSSQYPGVNRHSRYSERMLTGYRWYDAKRIRPLFAFGHGLSYTTFAYSKLRVQRAGRGARVTFAVKNTGARVGAEVAQVYVTQPAAAREPPKQLKGFRKLALKPGQRKRVAIVLDRRAFSRWSTSTNTWMVTRGTYRIRVGGSSRDLPLSGRVVLRRR